MLKYLFEATFKDGHMIRQPLDDRYSKHEEGAEHNFSAFTDVLDYMKQSPLAIFALIGHDRQVYAVSLETGEFFVNGTTFMLDQPLEELLDRKIIYFRTMRANLESGEQMIYAYNFGYEGKHPESGKIMKRIVTIR
jgi:hypothetical protein